MGTTVRCSAPISSVLGSAVHFSAASQTPSAQGGCHSVPSPGVLSGGSQHPRHGSLQPSVQGSNREELRCPAHSQHGLSCHASQPPASRSSGPAPAPGVLAESSLQPQEGPGVGNTRLITPEFLTPETRVLMGVCGCFKSQSSKQCESSLPSVQSVTRSHLGEGMEEAFPWAPVRPSHSFLPGTQLSFHQWVLGVETGSGLESGQGIPKCHWGGYPVSGLRDPQWLRRGHAEGVRVTWPSVFPLGTPCTVTSMAGSGPAAIPSSTCSQGLT